MTDHSLDALKYYAGSVDSSIDPLPGLERQPDPLIRLGTPLLSQLGEDPNRPGLIDTPRRWASWWREFIDYRDDSTATTGPPPRVWGKLLDLVTRFTC